MIVENVSTGPVEAARIGCLLALGSAFRWQSGGHMIKRQGVLAPKRLDFSVESEIWLDGTLSGLVYR